MTCEVYNSNKKINKPKKVTPLENYILNIEYDDGKVIDFDMKTLLDHSLFKSLKDEILFKNVWISGSAICWQNDIDICADSLYG